MLSLLALEELLAKGKLWLYSFHISVLTTCGCVLAFLEGGPCKKDSKMGEEMEE